MFFHASTFPRSPRVKTDVFDISLGNWARLMHWKTMFDCYYCISSDRVQAWP